MYKRSVSQNVRNWYRQVCGNDQNEEFCTFQTTLNKSVYEAQEPGADGRQCGVKSLDDKWIEPPMLRAAKKRLAYKSISSLASNVKKFRNRWPPPKGIMARGRKKRLGGGEGSLVLGPPRPLDIFWPPLAKRRRGEGANHLVKNRRKRGKKTGAQRRGLRSPAAAAAAGKKLRGGREHGRKNEGVGGSYSDKIGCAERAGEGGIVLLGILASPASSSRLTKCCLWRLDSGENELGPFLKSLHPGLPEATAFARRGVAGLLLPLL